MNTEAGNETPRHSSNTGAATQLPDLENGGSSTVHYFQKHDTVKLAEHNFLLWKHQVLLILEGYDLEGFILGTVSVPPMTIAEADGRLVANPAFRVHKKKISFWLPGFFQLSRMKFWFILPKLKQVLISGILLSDGLALRRISRSRVCVMHYTQSRKLV